MRNHHDDTENLYSTLQICRELEEKTIKNIELDVTFGQLGDWLEELDERRMRTNVIEYYGAEGAKDNIKEYHKLCNDLKLEREKNNNEESNIECLIIDKLTELISKMKLQQIRSLGLFTGNIS